MSEYEYNLKDIWKKHLGIQGKMFSYLRNNYAGTFTGDPRYKTAELHGGTIDLPRETNKRISEWPTTDELILSEAFSICP